MRDNQILLKTIEKNAPVNAPANASVNINRLNTTDTILALIQKNPSITRQQMAIQIGKDICIIARAIKKLQNIRKLKRVGSDKTEYWKTL